MIDQLTPRNRPINTLNRVIHSSRRRHARPDPAEANDTRTRILEAAERLFAERGIEAVSVRSILVEAGVNVALAHYHFGSREGLITELLRMRVGPLMQELLRRLDEARPRARYDVTTARPESVQSGRDLDAIASATGLNPKLTLADWADT